MLSNENVICFFVKKKSTSFLIGLLVLVIRPVFQDVDKQLLFISCCTIETCTWRAGPSSIFPQPLQSFTGCQVLAAEFKAWQPYSGQLIASKYFASMYFACFRSGPGYVLSWVHKKNFCGNVPDKDDLLESWNSGRKPSSSLKCRCLSCLAPASGSLGFMV